MSVVKMIKDCQQQRTIPITYLNSLGAGVCIWLVVEKIVFSFLSRAHLNIDNTEKFYVYPHLSCICQQQTKQIYPLSSEML